MATNEQSRLGDTPEEAVKSPVRVNSAANITLSGEQTVNTVDVVEGDRVLVDDQIIGADDGIYVVKSGAWVRASDWNKSNDIVNGVMILSTSNRILFEASFSGDFDLGTTEPTFTDLIANVVDAHDLFIRYDTLDQALAGTDILGSYIWTAVYSVAIGGGGNLYRVVANATGTPDGGEFIDRTDGSGFQLQGIFTDGVNVSQFGGIGDNVADDSAKVQNAVNAFPRVSITDGTYNLNGTTITVGSTNISLEGGVLSNGTLSCTETSFTGLSGLSETITLSGTLKSGGRVLFDWFTCEKSTQADYDTFINGNNATFGAIPSISSKNRLILTMLIGASFPVDFGVGIYPFDASSSITSYFNIFGASKRSTLLWCPNSHFLEFLAGGATHPTFRDIRVEAENQVLYTKANTVNAIHEIVMEDSFFLSYNDHAFWNDATIAGGTGCPIYGAKVFNCAVYAGAGKSGFNGWGSGSNIYDKLSDMHYYYNGFTTSNKGIMSALFYNSSVKKFTNSNLAYAGMDYVFLWDKANSIPQFHALNNVFEENTNSFQAICKVDASTSNVFFTARGNTYIGDVSKESGFAYILHAGNAHIFHVDSPMPISSTNTIRNRSESQYVRSVTQLIDSGATKYRLAYDEPNTFSESGVQAGSRLLTPTTDISELVGMEDIFAGDSANISFIQIRQSARMMNSNKLAFGQGTTANRPTTLLYNGYPYLDETLGHMIWRNGANWIDATGSTV